MMANEKPVRQVEAHPYPLVFATISGAHLYGFPSPDSDYDLRGVHLLPRWLLTVEDSVRVVAQLPVEQCGSVRTVGDLDELRATSGTT